MCIIAFVPANVQRPTDETLTNCWNTNRDGAGIMYAHEGTLHVRKGYMTLDALLKAWKEVPPNVPVAVHFRIGTHGPKSAALTHPFRSSQTTAIMHNGILPIDVPASLSEVHSDTSFFTETVLTQLGPKWFKNLGMTFLIEKFLGKGNKLVVLDADGEYNILNASAGTWDEGVWFSNYSFRTYTYPKTTGMTGCYGGWQGEDDYGGRDWPRRDQSLIRKPSSGASTVGFELFPDDNVIVAPERRDQLRDATLAILGEAGGTRPEFADVLELVRLGVLEMADLAQAHYEARVRAPTNLDRADPLWDSSFWPAYKALVSANKGFKKPKEKHQHGHGF